MIKALWVRQKRQKQKAQAKNTGRDELRNRIDDMSTFLREQPTAINEYDEHLVRRLIEKANIFEDKFTVEFKPSVTVGLKNIISGIRHNKKRSGHIKCVHSFSLIRFFT